MPGLWSKIPGASRSMQAVQALTEAPTDITEGVNLDSVEAVAVFMHAPGGQTFDGTGRLLGYAWNGSMWVQATDADIDMADAAGKADWQRSLQVVSPRGKFQFIPTGVGLSGAGTTMTTEYLCTIRFREGRAE